MNKDYLGDSVYVEQNKYDPSSIVLTTENGLPSDPSNKIFLEGQVIQALINYIKRITNKTVL